MMKEFFKKNKVAIIIAILVLLYFGYQNGMKKKKELAVKNGAGGLGQPKPINDIVSDSLVGSSIDLPIATGRYSSLAGDYLGQPSDQKIALPLIGGGNVLAGYWENHGCTGTIISPDGIVPAKDDPKSYCAGGNVTATA